MVVSIISTNVIKEIKKSWEKYNDLQGIIKDPSSHPHYKWVDNHFNRKGKIIVGNDNEL
jgi:hypothetical protein